MHTEDDREPPTRRKALFFVRHNNDLDHMTPVVWHWCRITGHEALVVIISGQISPRDFRLTFLNELPNARVSDQGTLALEIARTLDREGDGCSIDEFLAGVTETGVNAVVAFDELFTEEVAKFLRAAERQGIRSVCLPHGDDPFLNFMIVEDDINYRDVRLAAQPSPFDAVVHPSHYRARRMKEGQDDQRVLGSSRYCDEWLAKLDLLTEPAEIANSEACLKLVLFTRSERYALFREEFNRVLSLILQFPNVFLVVSHHPRASKMDSDDSLYGSHQFPDPESIPHKHPTSTVIYRDAGDFYGSSLVQWSDAVLSLGTTVVFEAVCRGKPVLELEYLHPNRTVVASHFKNADVQCRDHLFDWIQRLVEGGGKVSGFYSPREIKAFREA